MKRCLFLTSYPFCVPKHGGQVRAASIASGLESIGYQVIPVGVYAEGFFPASDTGDFDIILNYKNLFEEINKNVIFTDFIIGRFAANEFHLIERLNKILNKIRPDVIHLEQPWLWPFLKNTLLHFGNKAPPIVYSSHNIEWKASTAMYQFMPRTSKSEGYLNEVQTLEKLLWKHADLVFSISDIEKEVIYFESGREIIYLPPVSDISSHGSPINNRFKKISLSEGINYVALLSSAYWPNQEGFFHLFPSGLGFLRPHEQMWVGGQLGSALKADCRYNDFKTINDTRFIAWDYIKHEEKKNFFSSAHCVIVPIMMGAGSKLKMADAIASGAPVITTSHGAEGYGPLISSVIDEGVYIANTPELFQNLVKKALQGELQGCNKDIQKLLGQESLTNTLQRSFEAFKKNSSGKSSLN